MRARSAVLSWGKSLYSKSFLLGVTVFGSSTFASAAELSSDLEDQSSQYSTLSSIQFDYILQVILSLVLVVAVIVLLSFLLKKMNLQARTGSGAVRILSVIPLGAKDRLLLVAVGDEQLLLGSSPGNVQKLHTLEKPIDPDSNSGADIEDKSFMSVLSSITRNQQS